MNTQNRKRILLADNSAEYRRSVIGFLELEGYDVEEAGTPEDSLEMLATKKFDLVLADLRMRDEVDTHDMGGLEIAKFASENGIPCIIVTAFPTVDLARVALRARRAEPYARDLITKASGAQALLDSIHFILEETESPQRKSTGIGLFIDLERRLVWKDGVEIDVSSKQYELLAELWRRDGGVCTYVELIKMVYREDVPEIDAVNDTRIKKLVDRTKKKIKDDDPAHPLIATESGRGYRLNHKP